MEVCTPPTEPHELLSPPFTNKEWGVLKGTWAHSRPTPEFLRPASPHPLQDLLQEFSHRPLLGRWVTLLWPGWGEGMLTVGQEWLGVPPPQPPAGITAPQDEGFLFPVSTSASNLPEDGDQFPQGSQHVLGALAPQRCAGISKKPRDPEG